MLLLACVIAFTTPLAPVIPVIQDAGEIVRPSHGFALSRPAGDWQLTESPGDQPGSLAITWSDVSSGGRVRLSVLASPAKGRSPVELRDHAIQLVGAQPKYSNPRKRTVRVAGRKAAGLDVDVTLEGARYRARLAYLVQDDMAYLLQSVIEAGDRGRQDAVERAFFDSMRLIEIEPQGREEDLLLKKRADKCGSEFRWASSWDEAARIARKERRLILVYARLYAGIEISDDTLFGAFMDPDVVGLLDERFVALRLTREMDLPLRSPEVYGLSGSSFGTSLIVCDPDGGVVDETFAPGSAEVADLLMRALAARPRATGRKTTGSSEPVARAARHLRRGELAEAWDTLSRIDSLDAHRLRAEILRRRRDGEAALAEVAAARAVGGGPEGALDLLEARVLLGLGRSEQARDLLLRLLEREPESAQAKEARYWLGALSLKLDSPEAAADFWRPLALESTDGRWSWRAAAALLSSGFKLGVGRGLAWPAPEMKAALESPGFERLSAREAGRARAGALAYLLSRQRKDGSWISPSEISGSVDPRDNQLTVAITAICARSLLPHRQAPGVDAALEGALGWLNRARERSRAAKDVAFYMDYSVYANAYEIRFLAAALADGWIADPEAAAAAREAIAELVLRLEAKQRKGGGWSYYLRSDLNSTTVLNQSISFITAAATIGLIRAQQAGVTLPEGLLERALDCLERMRNDNLTFEYSLSHDREDAPRRTRPPGAAGRGVICALSLVLGGRRDLKELRSLLAVYFEHQEELARERGKALMHCGADAQGSHYVMFNYSNCAQAIAELPEREREPFRKALLASLLGARTADGAFLDNPLQGRAYGAGMALIAFDALGVEAGP